MTEQIKSKIEIQAKTTRRKVIPDEMITDEIFEKLLMKVLSEVEDIDDIKQIDVVHSLVPLKICNTTIAKVINVLNPKQKATQGSVASVIRYYKKRKSNNTMLDELMAELDKDF